MAGIKTLTIVGVGLIGGSLGMAVKGRSIADRVIGVGRNTRRLAKAKALGAIDEFTTDFKAGVREADIVVISVPVSRTGEMIKKFRGALRKDTVVTDAGSVKGSVVKEAEKLLAGRACFVGSHPMAGSEKTGVINARQDLFKNSTCIVTKTKKTDKRALTLIKSMWKSVGANVIETTTKKHDEMVSEVSHLPHILAYLLALQAGESARKNSDVPSVSAGAFRDMTRVAASSAQMWADISVDNKIALSKSIETYEKNLKEIKKLIDSSSRKKLLKKFEKAKEIRQGMVKDK